MKKILLLVAIVLVIAVVMVLRSNREEGTSSARPKFDRYISEETLETLRKPFFARLTEGVDDLQNSFPRPKLSKIDYEKAKSVFYRYLNNFAEIRDLCVQKDTYYELGDGERVLVTTEVLISKFPKYIYDVTMHDPLGSKNQERFVTISNGVQYAKWSDGKILMLEKDYHDKASGAFDLLEIYKILAMENKYPWFLNMFDSIDLDVFSDKYDNVKANVFRGGDDVEIGFDLDNGMMTYLEDGTKTKYFTYQKYNNIYYPIETIAISKSESRPEGGRDVLKVKALYSKTRINQELSDDYFNIDSPDYQMPEYKNSNSLK